MYTDRIPSRPASKASFYLHPSLFVPAASNLSSVHTVVFVSGFLFVCFFPQKQPSHHKTIILFL